MTTKQITDLPSATTANDNDLLLKRDDGANADQALSIQTFKSEAFGNSVDENAAVTATPDTLAKRDALGRVQSQSGGTGATAVVHNDTSENADADTVAKRDSSGRIATADGGSGTDAVNHNDLDNIETVPSGALMYFAMDSAPDGWLKANGATVSRTTFSALFTAIGTTFGAGDGSTTFELPDLRGEFIRGWDDGRGVDSGRGFGTNQLDQMQQITGEFNFKSNMGISAGSGVFSRDNFISDGNNRAEQTNMFNKVLFDSADSPGSRAGSETRPRNVALLACIKY